MDDWVARQRELLGWEREAEVEEAGELQLRAGLNQLCHSGLALRQLVVVGTNTGLYGRTIVTLSSRQAGRELAAHCITPGDIVAMGMEPASPTGVVTQVRNSSLAVAFTEEAEQLGLEEHEQFNIVKLANDVTYRRLRSALDSLAGQTGSQLVNVMFSVSQPSPPHQSLPPALLDHEGGLVWCNPDLDPGQRNAVQFCLQQRELAVVHGPPGTGKTTTVVEVIRQTVKTGGKVLVCAPSNVAVDNLVERLAKEKVKVVRLGHPARVSTDLQKHSLDAIISNSDEGAIVKDIYKDLDRTIAQSKRKDGRHARAEIKELRAELKSRERRALTEILGRAEVVLGTLTSAGRDGPLKHLPANHFQLTVIDEAGQALEAACWVVAATASKLVLAGDHLQLPPTIHSSRAQAGLEITMMERMVGLYGEEVTRMLTTQYRMHQLIMDWSSAALYSGQLVAARVVASQRLFELPGVERSEETEAVLLFYDTAGCGMLELTTQDEISRANEGEAGLVCHHVERLIRQGVQPSQIAVVTPYNLQVELLRLNLRPTYPDLEIKSVDGYQGREKEAVILSLVRSNPSKTVGFLGERRRLNVAVTRARRHLAVVGDSETVKSDPFLAEFVDYLEQHGEILSANQFADIPVIQRPQGMTEIKEALAPNNIEKTDKIRTKERKIKEPKNKNKPSNVKNVPSKGNLKNKAEIADIKLPYNETEKESKKKELEESINSFLNCKTENHLNFSSSLSSFERMLVHELAEEAGLSHESVGEGKDRFIKLSKSKSVKDIKGETIQIEESSSEMKTVCQSCIKPVPKSNMELHKLQCDKLTISRQKVDPASKRKKAKNKNKTIQNDGDLDQLFDEFQKLDSICNFEKCKVLVSTLGVTCQFCMVRFCLSHSMAEVHGCGSEARRTARASRPPPPSSGSRDKERRKQLARKLDNKVDQLTSQRKKKDKDNK